MTSSIVLDVRVYGLPMAQARVKTRLFKNPESPLGVSTSHYEPTNARDWKRTVLAQVLPHRPPAPLDTPLVLDLVIYLPRPASLPKRVQYPVARPDCKNLLAAVEDALTGIVWTDDARLVDVHVAKRYDPTPGVAIRIEHAPPLLIDTAPTDRAIRVRPAWFT